MMFSEAIRERILILDGSMGALLSAMGVRAVCPDIVNVESPEVIRGIHRAYIDAGADVIIADTFGSTSVKLEKCGLSQKADEIVQRAVENARAEAGDNAFVALDIGPTGEMLYPLGTLRLTRAVDVYAEQMRAGIRADFAFMETMTDIAECRAAMLAARKTGMPFAASFTFEASGRTMTGGSPACAAIVAQALGAIAVGMNCSGGPDHMLDPIARMRAVCSLPILVQPNAGLPVMKDGVTSYPFGPERFRDEMRAILDAGASGVGGCCGTTPEHIRLLAELAKTYPAARIPVIAERYVCSQRAYMSIDTAIANRELVGDVEDLYDFEGEDTLAVLDLRGMSAEDARETVSQAQTATHAPLGFVADGEDALDAALSEYAGVAAVAAPDAFRPILEMYGALAMPEM